MKIFLAMALTTALPLMILSGIVIYQVNQQIDKDQEYAENRIKQDLALRVEERALIPTIFGRLFKSWKRADSVLL